MSTISNRFFFRLCTAYLPFFTKEENSPSNEGVQKQICDARKKQKKRKNEKNQIKTGSCGIKNCHFLHGGGFFMRIYRPGPAQYSGPTDSVPASQYFEISMHRD